MRAMAGCGWWFAPEIVKMLDIVLLDSNFFVDVRIEFRKTTEWKTKGIRVVVDV